MSDNHSENPSDSLSPQHQLPSRPDNLLTLPIPEDDQTDSASGPGAASAAPSTGEFNKANLPGTFMFIKVQPRGEQDPNKQGAFLVLAYDPQLLDVNHLNSPAGLATLKNRYMDPRNAPYFEDLTARSGKDNATTSFIADAFVGLYGTTQSEACRTGWYGGLDRNNKALNVVYLTAEFNAAFHDCKKSKKDDKVGKLSTHDPQGRVQQIHVRDIYSAPSDATIEPNTGQYGNVFTVEFFTKPRK